jgi:minor extracellular protease Epr
LHRGSDAAHDDVECAPQNVPRTRIDLPPRPRPWDASTAALANAIAAGEGYAVVAIKEPASAPTLRTGVREAVSARTVSDGLALVRGRGIEVFDVLDRLGMVRVRGAPALIAALRGHPLVDFVEPRQYGSIAAQTGTQIRPWGITMVRAPVAWQLTRGGTVTFEIIDTGHEWGREDLPFPPFENCNGVYGGCNDGPDTWHGTHVFGILAARDNSVGVVGVAPGVADASAFLYGACLSSGPSAGSCPTDEVTAGINAGIWTVRVMNLSLTQPYDAAQASAVAMAWGNDDIVIVAAAGNNIGYVDPVYPASYTGVIGVSGVLSNKVFASSSVCGTFSNNGPMVDLAAPFEAYSTWGAAGYETACGTSMATPHVAGAAVLVRAAYPTWNNTQVESRLFSSAEDLGLAGRDDHYGHGLVDAAAAVGYPRVSIVGPTSVRPRVACYWYSTVEAGTPPYSYSWSAPGGFSTSSDFTYTNQGSNFTIWLTVRTAEGRSVQVSQPVTVSSTAPRCFL